MSGRAGYALLATLWICLGLGTLSWLVSVNARDAMATSRNRMALTRAAWTARGCLARVRERVRAALAVEQTRGPDPFGAVWDHLDRVVAPPAAVAGDCVLGARPVGARLAVNASDETRLARVLRAAGLPAPAADSAAAALTDWIDADTVARPLGAEHAWYAARGRTGPSNQPFVHMSELRLVRGLETLARLDSVLDVEAGPIALNHAVPEVLSLLPGFTDETIRAMLDARARGRPVATFHELTALLDPQAATASAQLPGIVVFPATAWLVTVRSRAGDPPTTAVLEVRLVRGANTTFTARQRSWVE